MNHSATRGHVILMRYEDDDEPVIYVIGTCSNGHGWMRAAGASPPPNEPAREPVWGTELEDALLFASEREAAAFIAEHRIAKAEIQAVVLPAGYGVRE